MAKVGGVLVPFEILQSSELTSSEKLVYSYILSFQVNSERCFASFETIANRLGFTKRTVVRSLNKLKSLGLVCRLDWQDKRVYEVRFREPESDKMSPDEGQNVTNGVTKCHQRSDKMSPQEGQNVTYSNNSNNNSNNKRVSKNVYPCKAAAKDGYSKLNQYPLIYLKSEQLEKLKAIYQAESLDLSDALEALSIWFEENPKEYKKSADHYSRLKGWVLNKLKNESGKPQVPRLQATTGGLSAKEQELFNILNK